MLTKVSSESVTPQKNIGDNLNYSLGYVYDTNYAHRLLNAGNRFYKYDSNGNIICEQDGDFDDSDGDVSYHKISRESEDVYSTDYGWGLFKEEEANGGIKGSKYYRTYTWNERNQLVSSVDANYSTSYIYDQDGQRTNKYTQSSETLYFNKMWTHHTDSGNSVYGGQTSKNIYLGETRIVTKLNSGNYPEYQEEFWKQYYYHSDHLGSASLISDYKGDEYQRIEYTPYGETWVEKTDPQANLNFLPYRFTSKEMDEETGLYYYGACYLDAKYSRWISTDPALGEYIPQAPINDEAKKHNSNLPGMGGVFNHINGNLYHYAGNNPVKYTDPNGREDEKFYPTLEEVYFFGFGTIDSNLNGYGFCFENIVYGDPVQIENEIQNIKNQLDDPFNTREKITVTKDTIIYLSMSNMNNNYDDIELIHNVKGTIYLSNRKAYDSFLNTKRSSNFYYLSEKYYYYQDEETGKEYFLDKNFKVVKEIE